MALGGNYNCLLNHGATDTAHWVQFYDMTGIYRLDLGVFLQCYLKRCGWELFTTSFKQIFLHVIDVDTSCFLAHDTKFNSYKHLILILILIRVYMLMCCVLAVLPCHAWPFLPCRSFVGVVWLRPPPTATVTTTSSALPLCPLCRSALVRMVSMWWWDGVGGCRSSAVTLLGA